MNLTAFKDSRHAQSPHYFLLGHPVAHSWSPLMHNTAARHHNMDARYHAIDLQEQELSQLASHLNDPHFLGANVTIPYKQRIEQFLDSTEDLALEIGAINTITKENGHLRGFNTDVTGFLHPLEKNSGVLENGKAVIFGTGGAAKAVVAGLRKIGVRQIYLISRSPGQGTAFSKRSNVSVESYSNWTSFAEDAQLIVNTTPLGMHPQTEESPVRDTETSYLKDAICYDLVYNPIETSFLQQASSAGAKETIGGLEMLIRQAAESFKLWTGKEFPIGKIKAKLDEQIQA